MRPTDKATADSRSEQSFAVIENTGHGNFLLAVFTLELEMDYQSWTGLCTVTPPPQTPFLRFFLRGGGGCTQAEYLERITPSSNCAWKSTDKVRRVVHSKLKLFHFQVKTYYLSDANHQTDNPSHKNNSSQV